MYYLLAAYDKMNCYSLFLVVFIIIKSTEENDYDSLNEYCTQLGCDECTMFTLNCRSGKLQSFPEVGANNYKTLDISYQSFFIPTLHRALFKNF